MRYRFPRRSVSKSSSVTLSTPGAPLLAFTCRYASQTSHLEISNDFPADFSLSMQLLPDSFPVDPRTTPQMTRPLRSTPTAPSRDFTATTNRSASTPQIGTQSLTGSSPLGTLPLAAPTTSGTPVPGHAFPRSLREQQIRLTTPTCRTPPGQSTAIRRAPPKAVLIRLGFDVTYVSNDTSTAVPKIRTAHRLPDPHLTHQVRLFPSRSPRRSSANAAPGGLEPPAVERFRRAYLHLSHSIASRSLDYMIRPLSTFVAHQGS